VKHHKGRRLTETTYKRKSNEGDRHSSTEFPAPSSSSPTTEVNPAKDLQSYFDSLATDKKLPGVLLVAKGGVTIASKAAGTANKATGAAIDRNTKFNVGSDKQELQEVRRDLTRLSAAPMARGDNGCPADFSLLVEQN
jgi:hypothetical protein